MFKVLAIIAYDGSAFMGFAPQARNFARGNISALGVSDKIALVLQSIGAVYENEDSKREGVDSDAESTHKSTNSKTTKSQISILSAGRTDKGVHSRNMPICFYLPQRRDLVRLREILNAKLYPHIFCKSLHFVAEDFHPRFLALSRTYCYIASKTAPNPFFSRFVSWEDYGDIARVKEALRYFKGTHDFKLFCKGGLEGKSSVREIFNVYCKEIGGNLAKRALSQSNGAPANQTPANRVLIVRICAQGFLRSQVRLMLGAVFAYGRGEISLESLCAQIDAKTLDSKIPKSRGRIYKSKQPKNAEYVREVERGGIYSRAGDTFNGIDSNQPNSVTESTNLNHQKASSMSAQAEYNEAGAEPSRIHFCEGDTFKGIDSKFPIYRVPVSPNGLYFENAKYKEFGSIKNLIERL